MISAIQAWGFLLDKSRRANGVDGETICLHWLLRLGVLACFVGHGAFGVITKSDWLPFFRVFHIPDAVAYKLMPLIGVMDITIGFLVFFRPMRIVVVWAAFWCLWTALMRPISGMSFFETLERAGNYGIPIALLLSTFTDAPGLKSWFSRLRPRPMNPSLARNLMVVCLVTTSLLLLGHGGFGMYLQKEQLEHHYASVGINGGLNFVQLVGTIEIAMAVLVLLFPARLLLIFIAAWKIFAELLYPASGSLVFETIERGGSYVAPIAVVVMLSWIDTRGLLHQKGTDDSPPARMAAGIAPA